VWVCAGRDIDDIRDGPVHWNHRHDGGDFREMSSGGSPASEAVCQLVRQHGSPAADRWLSAVHIRRAVRVFQTRWSLRIAVAVLQRYVLTAYVCTMSRRGNVMTLVVLTSCNRPITDASKYVWRTCWSTLVFLTFIMYNSCKWCSLVLMFIVSVYDVTIV